MNAILEPEFVLKLYDYWGNASPTTIALSESCTGKDYKSRFSQVIEIKSQKNHIGEKLTNAADLLFLAAQDSPLNSKEFISYLLYLNQGGIAIIETDKNWKIPYQEVVQIAKVTNTKIIYSGKSTIGNWQNKKIKGEKICELLIIEKQLALHCVNQETRASIVLPLHNSQKLQKWINFISQHELEKKLEIITVQTNTNNVDKKYIESGFINFFPLATKTSRLDSIIRKCLTISKSGFYLIDMTEGFEFHADEIMNFFLLENDSSLKDDLGRFFDPLKYKKNKSIPINKKDKMMIIEGVCIPKLLKEKKINVTLNNSYYFINHKVAQKYFSSSHRSKILNNNLYVTEFMNKNLKYTNKVECRCL